MGRINNEKSKVLATTTLAGALLFTGVGATHHANAAESEVTANNATDIGISVMKEYGQHPENVNFNTPEDRGDHYVIFMGINLDTEVELLKFIKMV